MTAVMPMLPVSPRFRLSIFFHAINRWRLRRPRPAQLSLSLCFTGGLAWRPHQLCLASLVSRCAGCRADRRTLRVRLSIYFHMITRWRLRRPRPAQLSLSLCFTGGLAWRPHQLCLASLVSRCAGCRADRRTLRVRLSARPTEKDTRQVLS